MIFKMTKGGNLINFVKTDIEDLDNVDNVIVIGSGIKKIILESSVRAYLMRTFAINDELYLLSPDSIDSDTGRVQINIIDNNIDYAKINILKNIDLSGDLVPKVLDRRIIKDGIDESSEKIRS